MKIYAITDTHFSHEKLKGFGRHQDFHNKLLDGIRRLSGDMLIHCGDFCIGNDAENAEAFMEAASGFDKKILVRGNHDNKSYSWYLKRGWDHVCEVMQMRIHGKEVLFSHMPFPKSDYSPTPYHKPVIHFHGHMHGGMAKHDPVAGEGYLFDLAPEIHGYSPINITKIIDNL